MYIVYSDFMIYIFTATAKTICLWEQE